MCSFSIVYCRNGCVRKKIRKLRKNVDLKTKLLIIGEKIKNNKSLDDIAAQFGLERSTISKIVKSRDSTIQKVEEGKVKVDAKRIQKGRFSLVESVLMGWIKIQQSLYIPLSGAIVREKALQFYKQLKEERQIEIDENFIASAGWLQKFQQRHNLSFQTQIGESGSS